MKSKLKIYDLESSRSLALDKLIEIFLDSGVERIFYKLLSPNDNSKNQPYMAGDINDIGFIPTGGIEKTETTSKKSKNPKRQIKYTFKLDYSWLSPDGDLYPAPNAKLIYYPQYPEVRLSGFVTRTGFDMGGWMNPDKKGRTEGRVLFLGVTKSEKIIAYLAVPDSRIAREVADYSAVDVSGVFKELIFEQLEDHRSSKEILLSELVRIHNKEWIESKRIYKDGSIKEYTARNGGGYTLEAELGISPNGFSEPDFMGWEIKQFGVKRCDLTKSKPLTIMTPEPDAGFYVEHGAEAFVRKFGYKNQEINDRYDFTGSHYEGIRHGKSGFTLTLDGFDKDTGLITNIAGQIALIDENGELASGWSFTKILEHWKKKHSRAAYIPSTSKVMDNKLKHYSYCANIRLYDGTSFLKLLNSFAQSFVYYDPGIKLENASTKPKTKRRSQFRIKSRFIDGLYDKKEEVDLKLS